MATGAAVVGVVAGAVEQLARPDIDQVITDAVALPLTEQINRRFPLSAPVTNEVVEGVKSLNLVRAIRERIERAMGERK